jgi:hypothetical protein
MTVERSFKGVTVGGKGLEAEAEKQVEGDRNNARGKCTEETQQIFGDINVDFNEVYLRF